jgi:hypothetical protein
MSEDSKHCIEIEDATFTWDASEKEPTLQNINLQIEKGNLLYQNNISPNYIEEP